MDISTYLTPLNDKIEDFKLPVEWLVQAGRNSFKLLLENRYEDFSAFRNDMEYKMDDSDCNCTKESGCGTDCHNKMLFIECKPKLCPSIKGTSRVYCNNCVIQERRYPDIQTVDASDSRGICLRVLQNISKGTIICEYTGEVITSRECQKRMAQYSTKDCFYFAALGNGYYLDAKYYGSFARFANHSCNPNCELQKWLVDGINRIVLAAKRDIVCGEEVTYHYQYYDDGMEDIVKKRQKCHCGSNNCCGTIGGRVESVSTCDKWMTRALQLINSNAKRYHILEYLECFDSLQYTSTVDKASDTNDLKIKLKDCIECCRDVVEYSHRIWMQQKDIRYNGSKGILFSEVQTVFESVRSANVKLRVVDSNTDNGASANNGSKKAHAIDYAVKYPWLDYLSDYQWLYDLYQQASRLNSTCLKYQKQIAAMGKQQDNRMPCDKALFSFTDIVRLLDEFIDNYPIVIDESSAIHRLCYNAIVRYGIWNVYNLYPHVLCWKYHYNFRKSYSKEIETKLGKNKTYQTILKYLNLFGVDGHSSSSVALLNNNHEKITSTGSDNTDVFASTNDAKIDSLQTRKSTSQIKALVATCFEIQEWFTLLSDIYMNRKLLNSRSNNSKNCDASSAASKVKHDTVKSSSSSSMKPTKAIDRVSACCYCNLPENDGEFCSMIQCETCQIWYHYPCVHYYNVPSNAVMKSRSAAKATSKHRKSCDAENSYRCPTCAIGYLSDNKFVQIEDVYCKSSQMSVSSLENNLLMWKIKVDGNTIKSYNESVQQIFVVLFDVMTENILTKLPQQYPKWLFDMPKLTYNNCNYFNYISKSKFALLHQDYECLCKLCSLSNNESVAFSVSQKFVEYSDSPIVKLLYVIKKCYVDWIDNAKNFIEASSFICEQFHNSNSRYNIEYLQDQFKSSVQLYYELRLLRIQPSNDVTRLLLRLQYCQHCLSCYPIIAAVGSFKLSLIDANIVSNIEDVLMHLQEKQDVYSSSFGNCLDVIGRKWKTGCELHRLAAVVSASTVNCKLANNIIDSCSSTRIATLTNTFTILEYCIDLHMKLSHHYSWLTKLLHHIQTTSIQYAKDIIRYICSNESTMLSPSNIKLCEVMNISKLKSSFDYARICNLYFVMSLKARNKGRENDCSQINSFDNDNNNSDPTIIKYCWCNGVDDGSCVMIACDGDCNQWYHSYCMRVVALQPPPSASTSVVGAPSSGDNVHTNGDIAENKSNDNLFNQMQASSNFNENGKNNYNLGSNHKKVGSNSALVHAVNTVRNSELCYPTVVDPCFDDNKNDLFYCIACSEVKGVPYPYRWK